MSTDKKEQKETTAKAEVKDASSDAVERHDYHGAGYHVVQPDGVDYPVAIPVNKKGQ